MDDWRTITLEAGLERLIDYRGKSPPKSLFGIPVVSAKVVKNGRITHPIEQKIDPNYYPVWMTRGLPSIGDIVMTTEGPMGEVAQLDRESVNFALGQRIVCMRGKSGVLDNTFLKFLLISPIQQGILSSFTTGTTVEGMSQKALRSVPIRIPPYWEQVAIGSTLGALDDKINLNRRMNETLETMARAAFKDWFLNFGPTRAKIEGRKPYLSPDVWAHFPDRFDDEGKPEGWEQSTIGAEVSVVGGTTPSTSEPAFWNGDIYWATPKDLSALNTPVLLGTERRITKAGLSQIGSGLLPAGTVLLSSRAPIGYIAVSQVPVAINQGFIAMRCEGRLSNIFVWLWTQANMEQIEQKANGSTFQEISKTNFRPIPAVAPSPKILAAFDSLAQPIFNRIVANEVMSSSLASTRDLLLPKLMSGEIRVREAAEAIAVLA